MPSFFANAMLNSITGALLIVLVGFIIIKIIDKILIHALEKSKLDSVLHVFVKNVLNFILFVVIIIMALDALNVDTKSFITILGVSGAAVALALKDSLSNFAGGIVILFTQQFKKDDYIDIGGTSGTVKNIDLILTTLVTFDNKIITIPNGLVSTSVLTNYSKADTRRVDCVFGIGYDDDLRLAKETMLKVMHKNEDIFSFPEPIIGVKENADSCILIDFKVWTNTENYWNVKYYLEENVKLAFDEEGISIPYNQIDVHMKK